MYITTLDMSEFAVPFTCIQHSFVLQSKSKLDFFKKSNKVRLMLMTVLFKHYFKFLKERTC